MAETLVCPNCDSPIRVPASHAGAKIACPQCEKLVAVPGAQTAGPEDIMEGTPVVGEENRLLAPVEPDEDAAPSSKVALWASRPVLIEPVALNLAGRRVVHLA